MVRLKKKNPKMKAAKTTRVDHKKKQSPKIKATVSLRSGKRNNLINKLNKLIQNLEGKNGLEKLQNELLDSIPNFPDNSTRKTQLGKRVRHSKNKVSNASYRNVIYISNNSNNNSSKASTSTKRTKVVNNNVVNNTINRALTTTAHQNYVKIDNPGGGLCSLYSLYGLLGMSHNNDRITSANVKIMKNATSRSGFNRSIERGLNRLFKNPHMFSSDALAGNSVDISNPQYLIRESKILSNKLMQMGYKYYILIHPESKAMTDDGIIRLLRRAQRQDFEINKLVDEFHFTIMKYSNRHEVYMEAEVPIQKISNNDVDAMLSRMNDFTAFQQLGSLIHTNDFNVMFKYINARHRDGSIESANVFSALKYAIQIPYKTQVREVRNGNRQLINSDELRLHLRLGRVPIFRGTGVHWYRFAPA